ncbi:hypothetical protein NUW54_g9708 [Trametes sanguinea]|uniref:Uncharacterized protein n=1 Tax=Trametes sanguinea TaxID=158606 RepID=A0ACC1P466_9APHY|nr:hypothetical protein NUW54_g9708 [Trametes sanguinea]
MTPPELNTSPPSRKDVYLRKSSSGRPTFQRARLWEAWGREWDPADGCGREGAQQEREQEIAEGVDPAEEAP